MVIAIEPGLLLFRRALCITAEKEKGRERVGWGQGDVWKHVDSLLIENGI